ncbi:MAG: hypothetical protein GX226_04325 [Dehalococcoidales bacterium]|nr:hypothetical protein [Dehalococcoidales bacterium]
MDALAVYENTDSDGDKSDPLFHAVIGSTAFNPNAHFQPFTGGRTYPNKLATV